MKPINLTMKVGDTEISRDVKFEWSAVESNEQVRQFVDSVTIDPPEFKDAVLDAVVQQFTDTIKSMLTEMVEKHVVDSNDH